MGTDQEQFEDKKRFRANLPDIDLNKPPHASGKGVPGDLSPDDEVIELVDVVMQGDVILAEKAKEDSPELSRTLEKETAENGSDIFDSLDFDFKAPEDLAKPTPYTASELPQDDPADVMAGVGNADETDESGSTAISEGLTAISTERLEKMITETVKDVVERVTRETMSEIAEKVIKEAIEGLKQSLEPPPA